MRDLVIEQLKSVGYEEVSNVTLPADYLFTNGEATVALEGAWKLHKAVPLVWTKDGLVAFNLDAVKDGTGISLPFPEDCSEAHARSRVAWAIDLITDYLAKSETASWNLSDWQKARNGNRKETGMFLELSPQEIADLLRAIRSLNNEVPDTETYEPLKDRLADLSQKLAGRQEIFPVDYITREDLWYAYCELPRDKAENLSDDQMREIAKSLAHVDDGLVEEVIETYFGNYEERFGGTTDGN